MINKEQRSNYWNYVTRNAKAVDDHNEIEKAKKEYVNLCHDYAKAHTSEDLKVFNWVVERYPKYHNRFLPYFFHLDKYDNWQVKRSPIWDYFCSELCKTYNSLRLDTDLTYLASCAIMEEIRLIESEGYEYNEDDNTFLLQLPIQYILSKMTKGQRKLLASSVNAFSNFQLMKDLVTGDDFLEMIDY